MRGHISPQNLRKSIELCLDFVDNLDNEDVYTSWKETFPKLAYQLNFCSGNIDSQFRQEEVLTGIVYPKVLQMIDRKQEKQRRIRASQIIADLLKTQGS